MNNLYESDKYETIEGINYVSGTIIHRLYSSFDSIDEESKAIEKQAYEKSSQYFDPDAMDETHGMEEACHEGVNHYIVHNQMKQEFLNSSITWLFHQFEKDCTRIFNTENGAEKKNILNGLGIDTSDSSSWSKCNRELRLLANTIKHGEGGSSKKLKALRPELFKKTMFGVSEYEIEVSIKDVECYTNHLLRFWEGFFSAVLPEHE